MPFTADEYRNVVAGDSQRVLYHAEKATLAAIEPIARDWIRREVQARKRGHIIFMDYVRHLSKTCPKTDADLAHHALLKAAENEFAIHFKMPNYVYTIDAEKFLAEHCSAPGYLSLSSKNGCSYFFNDEAAAMMFKLTMHRSK